MPWTFMCRVKRTKKPKSIISAKIITREKKKRILKLFHTESQNLTILVVSTGVLFLTVSSGITSSVLPLSATVNITHYFHCNLRVLKSFHALSLSLVPVPYRH